MISIVRITSGFCLHFIAIIRLLSAEQSSEFPAAILAKTCELADTMHSNVFCIGVTLVKSTNVRYLGAVFAC